ncbi:MAG TPA: polysaccharide deacetylase family protein, partial [Terriglobia bacterium]|nr:polysaccharide deacetylase family protein [Terriglobia bacterium]
MPLAALLLIVLLAATLAAKGPSALVKTTAPAHSAGGDKLIALTFDDGPKPYVLMGTRSGKGIPSQSLLALLDRQGVKATFFVMGWRLSKNADAKCRQDDGGVCREAAEEEHRRGHEIENHTYGHGDFRQMQKRYGV